MMSISECHLLIIQFCILQFDWDYCNLNQMKQNEQNYYAITWENASHYDSVARHIWIIMSMLGCI